MSAKAPAAYVESAWHLAGLHAGREITCTNVRTLLLYLTSDGARKVAVTYMRHRDPANGRTAGSIDVTLHGPIADDGEALRIKYRVRHGEYWKRLRPDERTAFNAAIMRRAGNSWWVRSALAQALRVGLRGESIA